MLELAGSNWELAASAGRRDLGVEGEGVMPGAGCRRSRPVPRASRVWLRDAVLKIGIKEVGVTR